MHVGVFGFEIVLGGGRSQVAMLVEKDAIIIGHNCPHAHIKLAPVE